MKEKFYLFLDIDGVLWDWNWRKAHAGATSKFNPASISALNFLIETIGKKFDPVLVVTSTWRWDMQRTESALHRSGLKMKSQILSTPISSTPGNRAQEILQFLGGQRTKNLLIIDDENFDYHDHFPEKNIIKTNQADHSLNYSDAKNWLFSTGLLAPEIQK